MLAALATDWIRDDEYMPRERLASLLALALVMLAQQDREIVGPGRTARS